MKIRVLEVLATLKRAGAERVAVALAGALDRNVFEPAVVSLYDAFPGGLEPELQARAVRVWHLGKRRGFDMRMYACLRNVVTDFRPDIIHTHSYVLRYTLPVVRCPMVHTIHNIATRDADRLGRFINRIAFRRGVVPVAVAVEVAETFRATYGFTPATIPNGVDTGRFRLPVDVREEWRARHGFDRNTVLIVSVARLDPQKNPLGLVRAFEAAHVDADLLFVGGGVLDKDLSGHPHVHVLGVRGDIPEILAASDIFAMASHWEGHPLAVIEAMAAGLPVIATAVGGVPEIIGEAGALIAPADMEAFGRELRSLVLDCERRRSLAASARVRAMQFDVSRMVKAYAELFERLVCESRC